MSKSKRPLAFAALIAVAACLAAFCAAWAASSHYEFGEVCYKPGPASCVQLGFAPPDDFRGVRYAASADADAVGPFAWRIRIGIFDQSVYSLVAETLAFPGPLRERRSRGFGKVRTAFHAAPDGAVVEVHLENENRTYWVKLRRVP